MKITQIQTFLVRDAPPEPRLREGAHGRGHPRDRRGVLVRAGRRHGAVIHHFEEWLVGQDPRERRAPLAADVQRLALSGRKPGQQRHQRHRARALGHQGQGAGRAGLVAAGREVPATRSASTRASAAPRRRSWRRTRARLIEQYGYTALKMGPQPPGQRAAALERGPAAARTSGWRRCGRPWAPDIDIGVDPHAQDLRAGAGAADGAGAAAVPAVLLRGAAPAGERRRAGAAAARRSQIPIATGEMLYTKFEFRDLLVRDAVDIVQPDICCAGGILECKKIAAMAEAFYVHRRAAQPDGARWRRWSTSTWRPASPTS